MLNRLLSIKQEQIRFALRLWAVVAALTLTVGAVTPVWALSVSQAYLLGDWSSPTTTSTAPFTVYNASGFQLTLNSSGIATSATAVGGLTIQVTDRFYYQSNTGTIDPNEVSSSQLASRVNSEIAKLDDVGVISPEADAALNIDFTSGASVTLRTATTSVPVTGLILFEDAGLDPSRSATATTWPVRNPIYSSTALTRRRLRPFSLPMPSGRTMSLRESIRPTGSFSIKPSPAGILRLATHRILEETQPSGWRSTTLG